MKELEPLFFLLLLALMGGSIWGAVVLGRKWVKDTVGRVFLTLALILVFWAASVIAVFAGCTAVTGPLRFQ